MAVLRCIAQVSAVLSAIGILTYASDLSRVSHIRLLSDTEKATITAADGPAPPTCYQVISAQCNVITL